MKVVVTGAGSLLGQGILRSLRDSRLSVEVIPVDASELAAGLYWHERRYVTPLARDPQFMTRFEALLARERPDAVLVGADVELPFFAEHRERLESQFSTHIIVSSPAVLQIEADKYLTYKFLKENGFEAPDSVLPDADAIEGLIGRVGFPLIVKPRNGAGSIGLYLVRDRAELDRALKTAPNLVVQECVATDQEEYTAGVLYFEGKCNASIVMRRHLRDGNTYRAFVDHYPELNLAVRAIAEKLQPYGPANLQFRVSDGKVKVFEINARFSGTTPLRMRAGFNEVEMVLRHVLLGEPIVQPAIEPLIVLRHWSETVVRPPLRVEKA